MAPPSTHPAGRWSPWLTAALGLAIGATAIYAIPASTFFVPPASTMDTATGERWACPMMDFIGTRPGICPVCGMTLQRMTAGELSREQAKRMGVELVTIAEGPAQVTIRAYGAARYDARTAQVVVARIAGRVVRRHPAALHAGVAVQAGDPLIDLYSPEAFAAQGELAAAIQLGDQRLVAALRERFARWNLASVAQAIADGAAPVDTVTIRSPYAGRAVTAKDLADEDMGGAGEGMVPVGAALTADQPLLRLVAPAAFMVVVHVPEARARLLRAGQPVRIASDDLGELPDVAASISWIAPGLSPEIRAREIHLHIADPHDRLLPGSLVNARIQAVLGPDQEPADPADPATWGRFPLVPASAVLSTGVRHVAWRVDSVSADGRQRFAIAPLALGQRLEDDDGNDRFIVRAGLRAGDRVAAQGAFLIDSQAQLAGSPSLLQPLGAPGMAAPAHQHP